MPSPDQPETSLKNGPEPLDNGSGGPKGTVGPFRGEASDIASEQEAAHAAPQPLLDGATRLVANDADLHTLLERLRGAKTVVLDLETTGLDPREDRVRLISLTTSQGTWLVDCFQVDPRPLFPVLADRVLIAHNARFELTFLFEMGFELSEGGSVGDTMLMSQLLRGTAPWKVDK